MKKIIGIILLVFSLFFTFGTFQITQALNTDYLDQIKNEKDIKVSEVGGGEESLYNFTVEIANTIKIIFFIIAIIYFMIITLKLMTSTNTQEEVSNFKKGIIWISLGVIVVNIADFLVKSIYNKNMSLSSGETSQGIQNTLDTLAERILNNIIIPFIHLLEFGAAFFFIIIMIFAFFRLITSNGNEESAKIGKMTVLYAIIGFIVVKIASTLVFAVYGSCKSSLAGIFGAKCSAGGPNLEGFGAIVFNIINWMNSFVAIVVIILIIFIGAQIIFSNGEEEKVSKAKKSLLYIVIGIAILLFNYLILTFFFNV